jgi:tetratricopeptide (TPR) repeat protein
VPKTVFPEPTKLPLNDLEGIDLYDLGRLESEGIVNIEGLAHHELIDLIIETRVPVPRLIDWVDQSILYLHLVGGSDSGARATLRDYGIRTATDLLRAWDQAEARGDAEFEAFRMLLGAERQPYRLEVIRDALLDDEWITTVSCWRKDAPHEPIERRAVPSSVEALERWADKQLERERYGRALNILKESLKIRDTASTRRRIARIFATSPVAEYRDSDQARENATRAFGLAPDDHAGISELIDIYMAIEDYDDANQMCEVALNIVSNWRDSEQRSKEIKRLKGIQKQIMGRGTAAVG